MKFRCAFRRRHRYRLREVVALIIGWVLWVHVLANEGMELNAHHGLVSPGALQIPPDVPIIAWGVRAHARARIPSSTGFDTWDLEENRLDREDLDLGLLNLGTSRASTPISE